MDILLKPDLEKFVTDKITHGQFTSASQVVNEALEVLRDQEQLSPTHEAYLRREVQRGLDQLKRGERATFTAETVIAEQSRLADEKARR